MDSQQAVKQWRSRVYRLAWLRLSVQLGVGYCLAWGLVALILRGVTQAPLHALWWGAAGLVFIVAIAGVLAKRQLPSTAKTLAMLDRDNGLGGLLMTESAAGHTSWASRVNRIALPQVRWRGLPSIGTLGLAVAFVIAALLVPMPTPSQGHHALDVSRTIDAMQDQVAVLEEEQIFESEDAEQLRDSMERIKDEASGDDPGKTWEALDHLSQQIEEAAEQADDFAQQRQKEAQAAQALAEALAQEGESLSAERLAEAMQALAELAESAVGEPMLDGMQLPPDLAEALGQAGQGDANGEMGEGLSPEMLEQLADMMAGRQQELAELMEALEQAGLCQNSGGEGLTEADVADLVAFLQGEGQCDSQGIMAACSGAGKGGINQGPGHVEMIWQDPSSEEGVSFDPEVLPPGQLRDLDQARLLGTSRGTPQEINDAQGSTGGALTQTQADGGSASQAVIIPRHREAVQRYFERESDE